MKMETRITKRIFRNVLLSLFIYALPIILMWLAFYFSGAKPWKKTAKSGSQTSAVK